MCAVSDLYIKTSLLYGPTLTLKLYQEEAELRVRSCRSFNFDVCGFGSIICEK